MATSVDVDACLRQLSTTLSNIKEQIEWYELNQSEFNSSRPTFQLQFQRREEIRQDILRLQGEFISLALDASQVLKKPDFSTLKQRERWTQRLDKLEAAFVRLNLGEGILNN